MTGTPLELGYLLPTREQVMRGEHGFAPLLDAARFATYLGFDSLWAGDSLFSRARHDPLTLLAAIAAAVPGPRLGTAVLLPALRNPVLLAQQLATIDVVSQGRLVVGAGIGADLPPVRAEFAAAGVPFEGRVGRLLEGFELCRALWRGEAVSWDGRWSLRDVSLAPEPVQRGGPPIWYAAGVPAGVDRAARHFDGWFPIGPDAACIAERALRCRHLAADAGRPAPTVCVYLTICVDETGAGEAAIDAYLEDYYGVPASLLRSVQACFGGSAGEVIEWLRAFAAAGADHLVLRLVGDHRAALEAVARAREDLEEARADV